jgi:hypothetical protein
MSKKLFQVLKGNGELEYFQPSKLLHSLKRAGASPKVARRILQHVESELQDGMKTSKIYHDAFELLKQTRPSHAAKYDLKRALLKLGPSGYPFEKFIGKIWERMGYKVQVGVMVQGHCIEHEVDVVAENDDEVIHMECKYHNYSDTRSDVKTALYVHARMEDLKKGWYERYGKDGKTFRGMLVTNTQFSTTAVEYASCVGLEVLSWSYPSGKGLAQIIDEVGLHPITSLTSLNNHQISQLLQEGHVLCKDIGPGIKKLRLKKDEKARVMEEASELCEYHPQKK